jgi:exopolyphosphatase/guanosine-5'-triphosphate,3'-diphosphate pyrophosphatase
MISGGEKRLVAVIEVGSTGIRLLVAELDGEGGWRIFDRAGKPVPLGRDVFTSGQISLDSASRCLSILRGFRDVLAGWGIDVADAVCIATSALREARNRETFIDRVRLQTGFLLKTVEGIEEIRLMHLALHYAIRERRAELARSNSMVIEVGGGSTEIMLLRRNRIAAAHSLGVGTVRIQQQVESSMGSGRYLMRFLEESINTTCERLSSELKLEGIKSFICIGSDARIAAEKAGHRACDTFSVLSRQAFMDFSKRISGYQPDDLVQNLRIAYSEAEGMIPGLLIARLFLERTDADEVIVPDISIREGILISMASGSDEREEFHAQVRASAVALGKRYHFDENHSQHVAKLALRLFDDLGPEHGLDGHARLLLEVAGILHDIGTFIKTSGHHKHSEYILANSEIFGLAEDERAVVANVVRYHRKQPPAPTHVNFMSLEPGLRMKVTKLSAILRVADALDRGHTQRVDIASTEKSETLLVVRTGGTVDLSLERYSLEEKANMFEDVFGLKVTLA